MNVVLRVHGFHRRLSAGCSFTSSSATRFSRPSMRLSSFWISSRVAASGSCACMQKESMTSIDSNRAMRFPVVQTMEAHTKENPRPA